MTTTATPRKRTPGPTWFDESDVPKPTVEEDAAARRLLIARFLDDASLAEMFAMLGLAEEPS